MIDILKYKTDNSFFVRKELFNIGYPCLSFSTNGKFIRVGHCVRANRTSSWVEKYSNASDSFNDISEELLYIDNETFFKYLNESA